MTRPRYEKARDLIRERQVAKALERDLITRGCANLTFEKLPKESHIDWVIKLHGKGVILFEVKCRDNLRFDYDTYMISKEKIDRSLEISQRVHLPYFLIVRWTDGTYGKEITEPSSDVRWGGRYDRGDDADEEEVYHWPSSEFNLRLHMPGVLSFAEETLAALN